jgi:cytoskeletal protein CcmA (bactofilin family)
MPRTELDADRASTNGDAEQFAVEPNETIIAREDSLTGKLQVGGNGQVLGNFAGEIECEGELMIGPDAHVEADIRGNRVTVAGYVRGNVVAMSRLKITSSGRLEGDARVGALVVQEGGVHHGVIRVHPEGVPESPAPLADEPKPYLQSAPHKTVPDAVGRVRKFWGEFF